MTTSDLRSLLEQVAAGRLDPAEAARLLDSPAASAAPAAPTEPPVSEPSSVRVVPAPTPEQAPLADGVRRLLIRATARSVRVVADPSVATVDVQGPHRTVREDDLLRIESDLAGPEPGSWSQESPATWWRSFVQTGALGERLVVRVNPELAVEAEVTAGSLEVVGVTHGLRFRATAGSVKATGCAGPVDGVVQAGSAKLELRPTGASRVRCESGSVDLRLLPGSDVTVRTDLELGDLKVYDNDGTTSKPPSREPLVVGAGTATFDLEVVMGSIKVRRP